MHPYSQFRRLLSYLLDDQPIAREHGFGPRLFVSETNVLPLDDSRRATRFGFEPKSTGAKDLRPTVRRSRNKCSCEHSQGRRIRTFDTQFQTVHDTISLFPDIKRKHILDVYALSENYLFFILPDTVLVSQLDPQGFLLLQFQ